MLHNLLPHARIHEAILSTTQPYWAISVIIGSLAPQIDKWELAHDLHWWPVCHVPIPKAQLMVQGVSINGYTLVIDFIG